MIVDEDGSGFAVTRTWTPKHDQIVLSYILGTSIQDIADEKKMSRQQISEIVGSDQAKILIEAYRGKLIDKLSDDISLSITNLAHKGLQNLKESLEVPTPHFSDAREHQDRISLEMVKLHEKRQDRAAAVAATQIPVDAMTKLTNALVKSARVRQNEVKEGVIDVDFEISDAETGE